MLLEPFLSCTVAFLFVVIPINLCCQARHFFIFFIVRYLHLHSHRYVQFYVRFVFTSPMFT